MHSFVHVHMSRFCRFYAEGFNAVLDYIRMDTAHKYESLPANWTQLIDDMYNGQASRGWSRVFANFHDISLFFQVTIASI
jgi:hypothetical protein